MEESPAFAAITDADALAVSAAFGSALMTSLGAPHAVQNFDSFLIGAPHERQLNNPSPQYLQKVAPSRFSRPQE